MRAGRDEALFAPSWDVWWSDYAESQGFNDFVVGAFEDFDDHAGAAPPSRGTRSLRFAADCTAPGVTGGTTRGGSRPPWNRVLRRLRPEPWPCDVRNPPACVAFPHITCELEEISPGVTYAPLLLNYSSPMVPGTGLGLV